MSLQDSFTDFVQFEIDNIVAPDDVLDNISYDRIEFEYSNPSVGIDTGGNFVKHEIIGGTVVRQKTSDKPMQLSIKGVAKEDTARELELLRRADRVTLLSNRFAEDSVTVHVVSITTDPLEDGGAAQLESGEFLYSFSLECVELYSSGG